MIDFLLSAHWKQSLLTDFLFRKIEKYIFKNRNLETSISNLEKDQIPRTFPSTGVSKTRKNWQRLLWTVPLANLWTRLISAFQTEVTLKKTDEEGGQLFHNIREPPWQLVGRFCHGGFKLKILCKANSSQKLSLTQHSTSLLTYMRMIWIYLLLLNYIFRRIKRQKKFFWPRSKATVVQGICN